jgi:phosphate/sulfate permease
MKRNRHTPRSHRWSAIAAIAPACLTAAGCSRAPTFNILGSFFPAWILCGLIGIVVAAIIRVLFVRWNFEKELTPLLLVYPCLAAFITFTCWLLFYS